MKNEKSLNDIKELQNIAILNHNVYLYGAGVRLNYFLQTIKELNINLNVKNIIVTSKAGNPEKICGIQVVEINDVCLKKGDIVLLTVSELYIHDITIMLSSRFNEIDVYTINYEMINGYPLQKVYQMIEPFVNEYPQKCLNINTPETRNTTIWTCWWQGEELAPKLVQACWNSWKTYIPQGLQIVVITKDNFNQYIEIPQYILNKVDNGNISLATLSDMIRHSLLYKYGGMWLDATIYMNDYIPDEVFEYDIYTRNIKTHEFGAKACWAGWFFYAQTAGQELFKFVMEAFFYFYKHNNTIPYYLMIDYLTAIASNEIKIVEDKLNRVPYNNEKALDLAKHLNEPFEYDAYINYTSGGFIQKLTHHGDNYSNNTFYQYIINKYIGDQL